jgi:hypothetical protein
VLMYVPVVVVLIVVKILSDRIYTHLLVIRREKCSFSRLIAE